MELINLTPHAIRIRMTDDTTPEPLDTDIVIEPSKPMARIAQSSIEVESIDTIPVKKSVFGAIENLPDPQDETVYIVSLPVAQQAHRSDVVSPDTSPAGGAVRKDGQIFAVRGFQMFD